VFLSHNASTILDEVFVDILDCFASFGKYKFLIIIR